MTDHAPFLVTLGMDPASFGRLDTLRNRYYPPHRNIVPAHVSLFHKLPADEQAAIGGTLAHAAAKLPPIPLHFGRLEKLGGGLAVAVSAPGLARLHAWFNRRFAVWLTPQDRQPFWPHVTLMNKAPRANVARAFAELSASWEPWNGVGESLLLWRYRDGPWELASEYRFRGESGKRAVARADA